MSVWQHKRGGWYVGLRFSGGRREQHYLGKLSESNARYIDDRVRELHQLRPLGLPLSLETLSWVSNLTGPLYDWLLKLGLADPRAAKPELTLCDWCDTYIASRTDYSKSTKKGWATARTHMVSAFADRKMHEITAFEAHQFARDLVKRASSEHASKIVERIGQLYNAAIQAKLLTENPFATVKITGKPDKSRAFYLDRATSEAVLKACKHREAAAVFVLARWCGLRVPHEPHALEWAHIDFEERRIRVPQGTKTGFRVLPLFPEAFVTLKDLRDHTPLDQQFVIDRARLSAGTSYREWLLEAIKKAQLHGWPKLWHNLRASCRTDLEERFESHVCDAWLGHSHRVAKDHYLMVKPDDWERATSHGHV